MNEKIDNTPVATLFNNYVTEWRSYIQALIKTIILLSGSVLSITIGAFINASPPNMPPEAICWIRMAWYMLSFSLIGSLLTMFLLIVAQAQVVSNWKVRIRINPEGLEVIENPLWFKISNWVIGSLSFLSCLVGLALITYGAGKLL